MSALERWASIPDHPHYEVSTHGRVRSVARSYVDAMGRTQNRRQTLLRPWASSSRSKYVQVQMGRKHYFFVHRLVLLAFVGPCPPGMEACHDDGDPENNHLSNLRWDTHGGNMQDSVRHRTHTSSRRTRCPRSHPLVAPNLVPSALRDGHRECLACSRAQGCKKRAAAKGLEIDFPAVAARYFAEITKGRAA